MVLSIHGNSQIPILSGFDCLYFTTVILVLIKIQWELELIVLIVFSLIRVLLYSFIFLILDYSLLIFIAFCVENISLGVIVE